mmetsp:Transcript_47/g.410  ORF Transcript_47/g.410 Transcript_47/m.410 type:complete len:202 (+) Transcript_47:2236-2841(+)
MNLHPILHVACSVSTMGFPRSLSPTFLLRATSLFLATTVCTTAPTSPVSSPPTTVASFHPFLSSFLFLFFPSSPSFPLPFGFFLRDTCRSRDASCRRVPRLIPSSPSTVVSPSMLFDPVDLPVQRVLVPFRKEARPHRSFPTKGKRHPRTTVAETPPIRIVVARASVRTGVQARCGWRCVPSVGGARPREPWRNVPFAKPS